MEIIVFKNFYILFNYAKSFYDEYDELSSFYAILIFEINTEKLMLTKTSSKIVIVYRTHC